MRTKEEVQKKGFENRKAQTKVANLNKKTVRMLPLCLPSLLSSAILFIGVHSVTAYPATPSVRSRGQPPEIIDYAEETQHRACMRRLRCGCGRLECSRQTMVEPCRISGRRCS